MNGREFYDRIAKHALLDYLGVFDAVPEQRNADGFIVVPARLECFRIRDKGHEVTQELPGTEVSNQSWEDLELVLLGHRPAMIMRGITRVVGYYAQVRNFNKSKVAELADRGRGNYGVGDTTPDLNGETPQEVMDILMAGGADMVCKIGTQEKEGE